MGRDALIRYEQVAAAAETMKAAGMKPTSRAIRERLDNTGSMGTIHKLLQTWRAGQEGPPGSAPPLPVPVQRALLDFIEQERAGAKAALEAELAEEHQEAADLATDNERHAATIAEQQAALSALQAELATLQGRLTQMETELSRARADVAQERARAEADRLDLARANLRLEAVPRLEAELAALRAQWDQAQKGRVAAEQHAAVLEARLEAALARASKAEAEAADAVLQARTSQTSRQSSVAGDTPPPKPHPPKTAGKASRRSK